MGSFLIKLQIVSDANTPADDNYSYVLISAIKPSVESRRHVTWFSSLNTCYFKLGRGQQISIGSRYTWCQQLLIGICTAQHLSSAANQPAVAYVVAVAVAGRNRRTDTRTLHRSCTRAPHTEQAVTVSCCSLYWQKCGAVPQQLYIYFIMGRTNYQT